MKKENLLIIGAGAAGLMAAYILKDKMTVTIIEGRDYAGGRMMTLKNGDTIIEAGAEFVHGNVPITMSLLAAAGISPVKTAGQMLFYKNDKKANSTHDDITQEELIKKALALDEDMTLNAFLDRYYGDEKYHVFREDTRSFAEGFDLADPAVASVKALAKEWSADEDNYRIPGGYGALIDFLLNELKSAGVDILLGVTIKQVDWQRGTVELLDATGKRYNGSRLLVTVPVSILALKAASASLNFTPEIDEWQNAASQIGFGAVLKIIIHFDKAFWPGDTGFAISDQPIRTWWTQLPDKTPSLTGWTGGPAAEKLAKLTNDEVLTLAIDSLATIFNLKPGVVRASITRYNIFNWTHDKFSLGGYSFSYPTSAAAREKLNTPVEDTIYFAGEGIYNGPHPGTVEAAFTSARSVAEALLAKTAPRE